MKEVKSVRLLRDEGDAIAASVPALWAAGELAGALRGRGIAVSTSADVRADATVRISSLKDDATAESAGVSLPRQEEAFTLFETGAGIVAWGHDQRGLAYALTELADRVRHATTELFGVGLPLVETPATRVRSIARIFANEKEDKSWFYDKSMWIDYLSMLATNRFNRFSLTFGIQYDYPYHNHIISDVYLHFPYPFLLAVPGYDVAVKNLTDEERNANLEILRFIGREAARP